MCFGRAIWLGRSPSRNAFQCYCSAIVYHCGFAAYRKPPLVNTLASDYPIHQTVLLQKRRNSCDTRAHCLRCVVCSHGAAVLVRSFRFGVPAIAEIVRARKLHKLVRRYARAVRTAVDRLGDECVRLSFERRGAMLCTEPPALVDTPDVNCCYVRAGRCRVVRAERSRPTGNVSLV